MSESITLTGRLATPMTVRRYGPCTVAELIVKRDRFNAAGQHLWTNTYHVSAYNEVAEEVVAQLHEGDSLRFDATIVAPSYPRPANDPRPGCFYTMQTFERMP